jgi:hypothetical protein
MNRGMELSEVQEGIRDAESAAKVRTKNPNFSEIIFLFFKA